MQPGQLTMNGTNLLHLDLESDVAADWLFDGCSGSELIQNLNPPPTHTSSHQRHSSAARNDFL